MNFAHITSLTRRNPKRAIIVGILGIVLVGYVVSTLVRDHEETVIEELPPLVSVTTAAEFNDTSALTLIGTARALSEAAITAEQSGRVVSVSTTLGAAVVAGQQLAVLENSRERAAVLQAEGAYEAALAASAQSTIGVSEAENSLRNAESSARATLVSAYDTVNDIVLNTIDDFFSNPQSSLPGLRIDGKGYTETLNTERVAYQNLLQSWQMNVQALDTSTDLYSEIELAIANVSRTINFVDSFITVFSIQGDSARYSDAELATFRAAFSDVKASLVATQSSLTASATSLNAANDAVLRAKTAASGGTVSAADAQVKQALGVLRNAQASLAKTILTTPISGTVNTLSLKVGDYVSNGARVAIVANNQALELITYISDDDRSAIVVGDVVTVNDIATATVSQISPALDPETRKVEVRLVTEGLEIKNGDTVKLAVTKSELNTSVAVRVPITAIKFEVENGHIFIVEDGKLTKVPVVLGKISGNSVEITDGLAADQAFVVDARGLQAGDEVTVRE
jgi:multidrug efflux pump subunit AcrA (membrane-fusion protein)